MLTRDLVAVGAIAFGAVTLLMFAAPFLVPYGTYVDLDGTAVVIDHGWTGNGLSGVAYLIGDIFCHQQEARSLMLNGSQMPICIRDTGILVGMTIGFAVSWMLHLRMTDRKWAVLGLALISVTGIEWILEHPFGDMPELRLVSGIVTGIGAGLFFAWMAYRDPVI